MPADAEGARTWALAAGVQPAPRPRVEELLRAEETFVEELFDALLDALNFPKRAVAQRVRDNQRRGGA